MSKFLMTPEEIEIIKELREDAIVCNCSISEYLNQIINLASEFVILQHLSNKDNGLAETIRAKIEQSNPTLSNWSVGEKGEIIKNDNSR